MNDDPRWTPEHTMAMFVLLATLILFIVVFNAHGADLRRPPLHCDCPAPGTLACEIAPDACAACWEECESQPGHGRRTRPPGAPFDPYLMDYRLPKTIAVDQSHYESGPVNPPHLQHFTTHELLDDVTSHGFSAVKLWVNTNPFDGMGAFEWTTRWGDQMCCMGLSYDCDGPPYSGDPIVEDWYSVWTDQRIKVMILRFTSPAWTIDARRIVSPIVPNPVIADAPFYEISKRLYDEFWWRDLTVILEDWEQDWLMRSDGWYNFPASVTCEEREQYLRTLLEYRQSGVERARAEAYAEHGRTPLRVTHAASVNKWPGNIKPGELDCPFVANIISTLEHKPDYIDVSFWVRGADPTEFLDWIRQATGYPPYRIFIGETGERTDRQEEWFMDKIPKFWQWGIKLITVANYRQTWCYPGNDRGIWKQKPCTEGAKVEWEGPSEGFYTVQWLLDNAWRYQPTGG